MIEEQLPHFFRHLRIRWENRGDVVVGGAEWIRSSACRAPSCASEHARHYADNSSGLAAADRLGAVAPTLDLSVHVFRVPPLPT